jgi:hypothetical protein
MMNREPNTLFANFSLLFGTNEAGTDYRIEAQSGGTQDLTPEERRMIIEAFTAIVERHNHNSDQGLLMMQFCDDSPSQIRH